MRTALAAAALGTIAIGCSSAAGPSPEAVCKHVASLVEKAGATGSVDPAKCVEKLTEVKSKHGSEIAAAVSACSLKATSLAELGQCTPQKLDKSRSPGTGAADSYNKKSKATEARDAAAGPDGPAGAAEIETTNPDE